MRIDEGYIKYNCYLKKEELVHNSIMDELNSVRSRLKKLGLIGVYPSKISYGNASCRLSRYEFIISGTQTGEYENLEPKHFSVVTKADIAQNTLYCTGLNNASSESLTHAALYQTDDNINCVIHVHSYKMWTDLLHKVPTTPSSAEFGTPEIAEAIKQLYKENPDTKNKKIIALGGHHEGIISFGSDLNSALFTILHYL